MPLYSCGCDGCPACGNFGCGRISPARRCEACEPHRVARKKAQAKERPSFRERGYGSAFERNRKIRLQKDPICTCDGCPSCDGKPCERASNTADHIVEKGDGGSDHHSNLRSYCGPCHSSKTARTRPGGWNRR